MPEDTNQPPPQPAPIAQVVHPAPSAPTPQPVPEIPITTPEKQHAAMLQGVQDQIRASTGETHEVAPITPDSSEEINVIEEHAGDSINQFYERAVLGKPGFEPSKSFLKKVIERIKKKNPNAQVDLKK